MVFIDLEGTKQARKELAEKESKILLSLQGGKSSKPKPMPTPFELTKTGLEDYKQLPSSTQFESSFEHYKKCQSLFKVGYSLPNTNYDLEAEVDLLSDPEFLPKPENSHDMINLKALLEANMDFAVVDPSNYDHKIGLMNKKSPAYVEYKKKMHKLQKRKMLKTLIQKHGSAPFDLSLVDNVLSDQQVEDMIICLKLHKGPPMPQSKLFVQFEY